MSTEPSASPAPGRNRDGPLVIDGISYIPSNVLLTGVPRLSLKDNSAFGVVDSRGECPRAYEGGSELGFYREDTRFISVWEATFNGAAPVTLAHELRFAGNTLVISMTNRDLIALDGATRIPRDTFLIRRVITLVDDVLHELLIVRNFDVREHRLRVEQWAGGRFDDIFEVRGFARTRRGRPGPVDERALGPERRRVTFRYTGLDGRPRAVHVERHHEAEPLLVTPTLAGHVAMVRVPPKGDVVLRSLVGFDREPDGHLAGRPFADLSVGQVLEAAARPSRRSPLLGGGGISTDHALVNRAIQSAAVDLQMLLTLEEYGADYPYAGVPWFSAPFGRDGILTAYQLLPWHPEVARGVLEYVFRTLGRTDDPWTDAQPGKVFHEMRRGEMARAREVPFVPYYGSVDATPLALALLHEYVNWTHDFASLREWWPDARRALEWIERWGDADGDGFLEYACRSPVGLPNQGWKDSNDSVMHADGRLAAPPIRLCEVQAYAYRARMGMHELARRLGDDALAERLRADALRLRARFLAEFWEPARGAVHLALDGAREPCAVLSSNMGHCLWGGILAPEHAESVAAHLLSEPMFNGYGVRTLADTERAYNPMSYHNGSIWPHDNSLILEGLRNYGRTAELERLAAGLIGVLEASPDFRLPELFCGFRRRGDEPPVPYEVACKPQAWAAGSLFLAMKSMLGLGVELDLPHLVARAPRLTDRLGEVEVRGLRGRDWELDLRFTRDRRGEVTVEVRRRHGHVRVLRLR